MRPELLAHGLTTPVMPNPDRAILLTPPGGAAIAVVRLTGNGVGAFLKAHFSKRASEGRCVHGTLAEDASGARVIDDPVVVLHPGGVAADLNLHGGPWVVRAVLELARRNGFEVIDSPKLPLPPEAVVDLGDTDIAREVAAHLPLARTELAVRVLLAQVRAWENVNVKDEGVEPKDEGGRMKDEGGGVRESFPQQSAALLHPSSFILHPSLNDRSLWWLLNPPRVAIVGAANVGKSTLANQLFARERSITADLPGTTRDWVGEMADVNGLAVVLVDTPGLREAPDPIERAAIDRATDEIRAADLIVLVLDAARPLEPEQRPLLAAFPAAIRVVNKSDRRTAFDLNELNNGNDLSAAGAPIVVRTVATTGEGVDVLRRAIAARFGCDAMDLARPRWWTERQRRAMKDEG